jgi:hypothetical protein
VPTETEQKLNRPWTNKSGLAKAATILSAVFLLSLGLCGVNFFAVMRYAPPMGPAPSKRAVIVGQILSVTAWLELAVMALSGFGLLIVLVIAGGRAFQRLFESKDGDQ